MNINRFFVESLGWTYDCLWNNREFYSLYGYTIVDHGEWYISSKSDWYSIEYVDEELLKEFTELIKKKQEIIENPDKHTYLEYKEATENIRRFYSRNKKRKEKDKKPCPESERLWEEWESKQKKLTPEEEKEDIFNKLMDHLMSAYYKEEDNGD